MHIKTYMRSLLALFLSLPLIAQDSRFTFGVTGGVPIIGSGTSNYGSNNESRRYTIGPVFEYRATDHLSLVVNPLYRRIGNSYNLFGSANSGAPLETLNILARTRAHNLSLPILGKYTFRARQEKLRPFLSNGYSLDTSWQSSQASVTTRNTSTGEISTRRDQSDLRSPITSGIVLGGGIDYRKGRIHFLPEFRYTYTFLNPSNTMLQGRNRVDALISFHF